MQLRAFAAALVFSCSFMACEGKLPEVRTPGVQPGPIEPGPDPSQPDASAEFLRSLQGRWTSQCMKLDAARGRRNYVLFEGEKVTEYSVEYKLIQQGPYRWECFGTLRRGKPEVAQVHVEEARGQAEGARLSWNGSSAHARFVGPDLVIERGGETLELEWKARLLDPSQAITPPPEQCLNLEGYWQINQTYFHITQIGCSAIQVSGDDYAPVFASTYASDWNIPADGRDWKVHEGRILSRAAQFDEKALHMTEWRRDRETGRKFKVLRTWTLEEQPCHLMSSRGALSLTWRVVEADSGIELSCDFFARWRH